MHYYIDGYNLLFRFFNTEEDFSLNRQLLIEELSEKLFFLKIDATIVFDSHYREEDLSRTHFRNLEIIFTRHRETADERILAEIKSTRHLDRLIVVTSDKKLAWFARRCDAATETVEQFLEWVNKRYKNKQRQNKQPLEKRKPLKKIVPTPEKPPEACQDYYLEIFQGRYKELEKSDKPFPKISKKKIKKPFPEDKEEVVDAVSDLDRWLKIFERKLNNK